jgi:biotin carboxylase
LNPQSPISILIFGAGINQLELIREAKLMGIVAVVVDPSADPPGKAEADFYYQVDGKDYEGTKQIALKHNVGGIVTGQMEKPMRLMAKLAEELGYIFHSPEVVERSLNKWLMKQAFLKNNVPCANAILFSKDDEITQEKLTGFTFPLIIKPKDAFSSRGVYKVDSYDELIAHLDESRSFASDGDILIEEFLEGKEFSVESITFKGKTTVVQITEKFITPFPNTVEIGHLQPAPLDATQWEQVTKTVEQAIQAIGINNSASHAEVMVTSKGVFTIEIGARLGGDFISSYLTKASTGVSMDKAALQVALGMAPDLTSNLKQFSYIKYIQLPVNKRVVEIKPLDDLIARPEIVFATIFVTPGDTIKPLVHSALRPACILTRGETREQVIELADKYSNDMASCIILE